MRRYGGAKQKAAVYITIELCSFLSHQQAYWASPLACVPPHLRGFSMRTIRATTLTSVTLALPKIDPWLFSSAKHCLKQGKSNSNNFPILPINAFVALRHAQLTGKHLHGTNKCAERLNAELPHVCVSCSYLSGSQFYGFEKTKEVAAHDHKIREGRHVGRLVKRSTHCNVSFCFAFLSCFAYLSRFAYLRLFAVTDISHNLLSFVNHPTQLHMTVRLVSLYLITPGSEEHLITAKLRRYSIQALVAAVRADEVSGEGRDDLRNHSAIRCMEFHSGNCLWTVSEPDQMIEPIGKSEFIYDRRDTQRQLRSWGKIKPLSRLNSSQRCKCSILNRQVDDSNLQAGLGEAQIIAQHEYPARDLPRLIKLDCGCRADTLNSKSPAAEDCAGRHRFIPFNRQGSIHGYSPFLIMVRLTQILAVLGFHLDRASSIFHNDKTSSLHLSFYLIQIISDRFVDISKRSLALSYHKINYRHVIASFLFFVAPSDVILYCCLSFKALKVFLVLGWLFLMRNEQHDVWHRIHDGSHWSNKHSCFTNDQVVDTSPESIEILFISSLTCFRELVNHQMNFLGTCRARAMKRLLTFHIHNCGKKNCWWVNESVRFSGKLKVNCS
ncbi:hypothetical protein VP01_2315g1 [Puccinia sorghi]|uniref:Uncharacterized protein n=1 Tax=Puccinia sorghi TaxID=27349 RepID=A0A0L6V8D1_9BASI|nr:hypothetical protein VP01_2315g1 [Puccinia sorghi]